MKKSIVFIFVIPFIVVIFSCKKFTPLPFALESDNHFILLRSDFVSLFGTYNYIHFADIDSSLIKNEFRSLINFDDVLINDDEIWVINGREVILLNNIDFECVETYENLTPNGSFYYPFGELMCSMENGFLFLVNYESRTKIDSVSIQDFNGVASYFENQLYFSCQGNALCVMDLSSFETDTILFNENLYDITVENNRIAVTTGSIEEYTISFSSVQDLSFQPIEIEPTIKNRLPSFSPHIGFMGDRIFLLTDNMLYSSTILTQISASDALNLNSRYFECNQLENLLYSIDRDGIIDVLDFDTGDRIEIEHELENIYRAVALD